MSTTAATQHLESLIRSAFEEGRCGEYYIVDLVIAPNHHIGVFVDGDEGVSLDTCTQISRILESILDPDPALATGYELEVSSPGVSRPLKFLRQYLKHTGRTLKIKLNTYEELEGTLLGTSHETVKLLSQPKDKKSKAEEVEIPFANIKEAFVTVQFGKNKPKN